MLYTWKIVFNLNIFPKYQNLNQKTSSSNVHVPKIAYHIYFRPLNIHYVYVWTNIKMKKAIKRLNSFFFKFSY